MFTGIILAKGRVTSFEERGGDLELGVDAAGLDVARIAIGDSVCVQGVCLTVTRKENSIFFADVSRETLAKTTLGKLAVGSNVNLEPSLRAGDALGGHMVSGHVDAVGRLKRIEQDARSWRLEFELPDALTRFVAAKGSICLNGVSLTVNMAEGRRFDVNIIPHTHEVTTLGELRIDDGVNVEIDVVARYLDRLVGANRGAQDSGAQDGGAQDGRGQFDDGERRIPITTPHGTFKVWTKRIGNNPRIKLLLLHGGPGCTHEYFEPCESYLKAAGIEFYYYDQLGSYFSDQPKIPDLWELPRFVDEVEQVRVALGLNPENFFLLGHSWGGILALEYALTHQRNLKGLVISNMMASIPAYNEYAEKVLMPAMDAAALAEIKTLEAAQDYQNPRYMDLLMRHHYVYHVLRMPLDSWPDAVERTFKHLNPDVYVPMQGPSELGASGKLAQWDRMARLGEIKVPTLTIGARHDTMDPRYMQAMAHAMPRGRYLDCPDGSHMAMFDDQQRYFDGLVRFLQDVDGGRI
jgi:proline iminopeptidase